MIRAVLPWVVACVAAFLVARYALPPLVASAVGPKVLLEMSPSPAFSARADVGEAVTAEFTLTNVSDADVRVLGVRTSCGCVSVGTAFPFTIKPRESGKVALKVTTGEPDASGMFVQRSDLFVDVEGVVPALVIETVVTSKSPKSKE